MRYVTSIERLAIQEGIERGIISKGREDIIEILTIRFGVVPDSYAEAIAQIDDPEVLKNLMRQAIAITDVTEFQRAIDDLDSRAK
jgi:hypothetical protein